MQKRIYRGLSFIMTLVIIIQCLASNGMNIYASENLSGQEEQEETEELADIPELIGTQWQVEQGVVSEDVELQESLFLSQDITVKGNLELYDSLQLNGYTLTIEGDLKLSDDANMILDGDLVVDGDIKVDGGQIGFYNKTLYGHGDFIITSLDAGQSIRLTHSDDKLQISGDFMFYDSIEGQILLQKGSLELSGDFLEIRTCTADDKELETDGGKLEFGHEFQLFLTGDDSQMLDIPEMNDLPAMIAFMGEKNRVLYLTNEALMPVISIGNGRLYPEVFRLKQRILDIYAEECENHIEYPVIYVEEDKLIFNDDFRIIGDFIQNGTVIINGMVSVQGDYFIQHLDMDEEGRQYSETDGTLGINGDLQVSGQLFSNGEAIGDINSFRPSRDESIILEEAAQLPLAASAPSLSAVRNLTVKDDQGDVLLQWQDSQEDAAGYHIYRSGSYRSGYIQVGQVEKNDLGEYTYLDSEVKDWTTYYYRVIPYTADAQEGTSYSVKSVRTTRDTKPPTAEKWSVEKKVLNHDEFFEIRVKDTRGVEDVKLYYALEGTEEWQTLTYRKIGKFGDKSILIYGTIPTSLLRGAYVFRAVVTDRNGNMAEKTETFYINCQGIEAPVIINQKVGTTFVSLEWTMSESSSIHYEVQMLEGNTFVTKDYIHDVTYATIKRLLSDQAYTIRIQPYALGQYGKIYGIPSEPVTIITAPDTVAPTVTSIRPSPTFVGDRISLSIPVTDNKAVQSVQLEYSLDKEQWLPIKKLVTEERRTSYTFSYQMDTSEFPEGSIYIRAYAYDYAGNKSQGVQNEYIIDHTPPEGVHDLEAYDIDAGIGLRWTPVSDCTYCIMRRDDQGTYETLGKTSNAFYQDMDAVYGKDYHYVVYSLDIAENPGSVSNEVTSRIMEDTKPPEITVFRAVYGSADEQTWVKLEANDNIQLSSIKLEYERDGIWHPIEEYTCYSKEWKLSPMIPWSMTDMPEGIYPLRCTATDINGYMIQKTIEVNVDRTPPGIREMSVTEQEDQLQIAWEAYLEEDFSYYALYRIDEDEKETRILYTNDNLVTTCSDAPVPGKRYTYRLQIGDVAGNAQIIERVGRRKKTDLEPPQVQVDYNGAKVEQLTVTAGEGIALSGAATTDNVGIASMQWFVDESEQSRARSLRYMFEQPGKHTITLKAVDLSGNESSLTIPVTVEPSGQESYEEGTAENGRIQFRIVDENYVELKGAELYFGKDKQSYDLIYSDEAGKAELQLEAGDYQVLVYLGGYLPVEEQITVTPSSDNIKVIMLQKQEMVVGSLNVEEMTVEEILEHGIDINAAENRNHVKVEVELTYQKKPGSGISSGEEKEKFTLYGGTPYSTSYTDPGSGVTHATTVQNVSPINEPIIVIMDTQSVSWLKEMFRVDLQICNMAGQPFDLSECEAYLNLPAGLSFLDGPADNEAGKQIGSIPAGETYETTWYIRGDQPGTYQLTADFLGILEPMGRKITAHFQTEEGIEVKSGEGLVLYIYPENTARIGDKLYIQYQLKNEGERAVYDVQTTFGEYQSAAGSRTVKVSGLEYSVSVLDYYVKDAKEAQTIPVLYQGDTIHITRLNPAEAVYGTYAVDFGEVITEDGTIYGDIGEMYRLVDAQARILEGRNTGFQVRVVPVDAHQRKVRLLSQGGNTQTRIPASGGTRENETVLPPVLLWEEETEAEDPVDIATGAFQTDATALAIQGIDILDFRLYYNSLDTASPGELGYGWSHNYEMWLEDCNSVLYLHKDGGKSLPFIRASAQSLTLEGSIEGSAVTLAPVQEAQEYICLEAGWDAVTLLRCEDGSFTMEITGDRTYCFDIEGRLVEIISHEGNHIMLERQDASLKIQEAATGYYLLAEYDTAGRVIRVSDSAGRGIILQYDVSGNLIRRSNPNGEYLTYTYDEQHRITASQDPYGAVYLVNTYDEKGRVLSQDDGDKNTPLATFQYTEQENSSIIIEYTDGNGTTLTTTADGEGRILTQRDAQGNEVRCTYDSAGRITGRTWGGHSTSYTYDALGQLESYQDALGNRKTYTYDTAGNCIAISDASGITRYEYDTDNRLLLMVDARGVTTTYSYNEVGQVLSETNGNRGSIRYTYADNRLTAIQDREGNTARTAYDGTGRLISYTDGEGAAMYIAYDAVGNVTEIKRRDASNGTGITQAYTYDAVGNLTSYTDGNGNTTRYEYNIRDELLAEVYPDGSRKECTRDAAGNITAITYPETAQGSAMEQAVYDSAGNLTALTDIYGYTTEYQYGAWGVLEAVIKPNGGTIHYTYYENGLLQSQTDAEGNRITFSYDRKGNLTQLSDAEGVLCQISYDAYGQILCLENGCGNRMEFTYDEYGQVITSKDANGNTTVYEYDHNGNRIRSTDALGRITEYVYDSNNQIAAVRRYAENGRDFIQTGYTYDMLGNITSLRDGEGNTYEFCYDNNSNLTEIRDAYGSTIQSMEYDCRNQVARITDAAGTETEQKYDAMGRILSSASRSTAGTSEILYQYGSNGILSQVVDATGSASSVTYDTEGNITSITNPNGGVTEYAYDLNNNLLSETIGEAYHIAYSYDARNQMITRENARGQQTVYEYDNCGRLTRQTDEAGIIQYTYDGMGNLLTVTDEAGIISREYDSAGRLTRYTDTEGNSITYDYNAWDNVTAIHYPDGRTVTYTYDKNGKIISITDWSGRITGYTYNKNSQLISTERPDGSIETRTYNEAGQLIQISDCQGDAILHQYDYSYDGRGNIASIRTGGEAVGENDYSALQNCTMTYDANNRLLTYNGEAVTYDADGNMTYGPLNGTMTSFTYDCRNRLIQAGDTSYTYDAENHRIRAETEQTITRYVVDSQQELSRILQTVETDKRTGESRITYYTYGRGLLSQEDEEKEYRLYHFNHLGSTTLITDEAGKVVETFEYNPYGELLDGEIGKYPFLFNGEYGVVTDRNGLYYMRARYYNVDIKRFMNQDIIVGSVESSPSLNRYAYVEGNPVNYLDPFGLEKWDNEFTVWHEALGNISYVMAISTIAFPEVGVVTDFWGKIVAGIDVSIHLYEFFFYPQGSGYKYKIEHLGWIVVDLFSFTGVGNLVTVEFYVADKVTQEQYGKGYFEYEIDELIETYESFVRLFETFNYLINNKDKLYEGDLF
ncbi:MAG: DUF6531 domain-containing protein [Bacteroides sp.]|nr:DUF6531 domain-containing protein [Bacteroides sp.]MCM1549952.1 DUF6531 domain-containing protein [Clostridium sp.]